MLVGGGNDYVLASYTWTFPPGAVKGYGAFGEVTEPSGPGGGTTYTTFNAGPSSSLAHDPTKFPFTADDLSWTTPGKDHGVDSFYWGPEANGNSKVSIKATFDKTVGGVVVDSFTNSDSAMFKVVKTTGNIRVLTTGTAGLSTKPDGGGQFRLKL